MTGQTVGRLTIGEFSHKDKYGHRLWHCVCACGNKAIVREWFLIKKRTLSCGCLRLEKITKHGGSNSPAYISWLCMLNRCEYPGDKSYFEYGGRGIVVCDRWRNSFANFLADMGPRPVDATLDRINSDGNYCRGNCRWATKSQQNKNRRGWSKAASIL